MKRKEGHGFEEGFPTKRNNSPKRNAEDIFISQKRNDKKLHSPKGETDFNMSKA
jgi:hypothetical protein